MSASTIELVVYTMTLLHFQGRYLLLRRSTSKRFAPGRWTGVGGRVDPAEIDRLESAAIREIEEETGLPADNVSSLCLRRALLQMRPQHPLTLLLYFTGEASHSDVTATPEGELHWLTPDELSGLDIIENSALVVPLLIEDVAVDPAGERGVILGVASFSATGALTGITWNASN